MAAFGWEGDKIARSALWRLTTRKGHGLPDENELLQRKRYARYHLRSHLFRAICIRPQTERDEPEICTYSILAHGLRGNRASTLVLHFFHEA